MPATPELLATPVAPELLGAPVAVWAFVVSLLSFGAALSALGWQVMKHFLDGGRVKVYLNTAIWEPGVLLATNHSGRMLLKNNHSASSVTRGRALELAQLVVENPGRSPVTIYSPGLSFSRHGIKKHSVVPRMFGTGTSFGPDEAVEDTVVRLEPYARVTFLLDYWGVMPDVLKDARGGSVVVRGYVGVAGRTNRPQTSNWRRRWRIDRGMYTAIEQSPAFTPLAVLWRELYLRLPEKAGDEPHRHPNAGSPITRGHANYVLDSAMSRFDHRPERDELEGALEEIAKEQGDRFPALGLSVLAGYEALDRMEGHLTEWTVGLFYHSYEQRQARKNVEGEKDSTDGDS